MDPGDGRILTIRESRVDDSIRSCRGQARGWVSLTPGIDSELQSFQAEMDRLSECSADIVAEKSSKGADVYVSWNGATDVEKWAVYAGNTKQDLKRVKTAKKHGFETKAEIGQAKYVQVKPQLKKGSKCKNVDSAVVGVN